MAIQTFTAAQVLTAAQMNALQANDYNQTVSAKVASYTLVAADKGTRITMSNASATTITVNTSLFAAGDSLRIQNIGAGACTITAGTATVTSAGPLALVQWAGGQLFFTSASAAVWFPDAVTATAGGLVTMLPTSVAVGSGSATTSTLGQVTFTGCSTVSLNGVFTSSYRNYNLLVTNVPSVNHDLFMRLRVGGTDNSTASSYVSQIINARGATLSTQRITDSSWTIAPNAETTLLNAYSMRLFQPQLATATAGLAEALTTNATGYYTPGGFTHNQTVAYDGVTIYGTSGNMTGTITVYGYNQ